jgi:uncharacterized protein YceH (UPF0502 family)
MLAEAYKMSLEDVVIVAKNVNKVVIVLLERCIVRFVRSVVMKHRYRLNRQEFGQFIVVNASLVCVLKTVY